MAKPWKCRTNALFWEVIFWWKIGAKAYFQVVNQKSSIQMPQFFICIFGGGKNVHPIGEWRPLMGEKDNAMRDSSYFCGTFTGTDTIVYFVVELNFCHRSHFWPQLISTISPKFQDFIFFTLQLYNRRNFGLD